MEAEVVTKKQKKSKAKPQNLNFTELFQKELDDFNKRRKRGRVPVKSLRALNLFDSNLDCQILEFIRLEMHKKQTPALAKLIPVHQSQICSAGLVNSCNILQQILKNEEQKFEDEPSIYKLDSESQELMTQIIKQVLNFSRQHAINMNSILKAQTSFLGRVAETPFQIDTTQSLALKQMGKEEEFLQEKKRIQQALRLFVLHPCYLVR